MLERYIEPLASLGVSYDHLGPEVFPDPKIQSTVPEAPHQWVGLIPSAQWPGKRWAPEHFRLTLELLLKTTSERFLVFGGPSDSFCEEITQGLPPDRVINLQGKLNLKEVFTTLKRVKLCISNDTGLMHVADGLGIPNVLIFGPTNSDMGCLPFHPKSIILEHSLWCRPCSKNGQAPCIRSKRWCLELTTAEDVANATRRLINQLPSLSS